MRRHQIDLEPAASRDHSLLLQMGEVSIGADRGVCAEEIVEAHILCRRAGLEAVAHARRRGRMQAKYLLRFFERRMIGEYRFQMRNPIAALAGLPVGDAQKVWAERGAHRCEYFSR